MLTKPSFVEVFFSPKNTYRSLCIKNILKNYTGTSGTGSVGRKMGDKMMKKSNNVEIFSGLRV